MPRTAPSFPARPSLKRPAKQSGRLLLRKVSPLCYCPREQLDLPRLYRPSINSLREIPSVAAISSMLPTNSSHPARFHRCKSGPGRTHGQTSLGNSLARLAVRERGLQTPPGCLFVSPSQHGAYAATIGRRTMSSSRQVSPVPSISSVQVKHARTGSRDQCQEHEKSTSTNSP